MTTLEVSVRWTWCLALVACAGGETVDDPVLDALRAPPEGSVRLGLFAGRTPCDDCTKLKIALSLHEDADDGTPTTFVMERIGVGDSDLRHVSTGSWHLVEGPAWDPDATVLRLVDDPAASPVLPDASDLRTTPADLDTWLSLRDLVLVLLDDDLEPRPGDGAWSWTLSRLE